MKPTRDDQNSGQTASTSIPPTVTRCRRRFRVLAKMAAALLALGSVLFLDIAQSTSSVSAYCSGAGKEKELWRTWGREIAYTGATCDDLGDYYGIVADLLSDGTCVKVYHGVNTSLSWNFSSTSCFTYGNSYYFEDDNHYTPMKLCKEDLSECTEQVSNTRF